MNPVKDAHRTSSEHAYRCIKPMRQKGESLYNYDHQLDIGAEKKNYVKHKYSPCTEVFMLNRVVHIIVTALQTAE
jgi:hypothetical protein